MYSGLGVYTACQWKYQNNYEAFAPHKKIVFKFFCGKTTNMFKMTQTDVIQICLQMQWAVGWQMTTC
jgi:hypothetical protein